MTVNSRMRIAAGIASKRTDRRIPSTFTKDFGCRLHFSGIAVIRQLRAGLACNRWRVIRCSRFPQSSYPFVNLLRMLQDIRIAEFCRLPSSRDTRASVHAVTSSIPAGSDAAGSVVIVPVVRSDERAVDRYRLAGDGADSMAPISIVNALVVDLVSRRAWRRIPARWLRRIGHCCRGFRRQAQ